MKIWDYMPNGPFLDREAYRAALSDRLRIPISYIYTIIAIPPRKPLDQ
jgi:hypothetical protein